MNDSWDDDDDFLLDDNEWLKDGAQETTPPWPLLIVDDEPGIHDITKLALQRFSFEGRSLEFISAFSAKEALSILTERDDIAMILLDVVMETDHAGLECARQIRDDLNNEAVRIVLRTGQPGQAPEEDVILAFDINDYRAKTELTTQRLFTTVVSALRSYRDILALNQYREEAYQLMAEHTAAFQNLIDQSATPLFQLGRDLRIQRCNTAFAKQVEMDVEKLTGVLLENLPAITFNTDTMEVSLKERTTTLTPTNRPDGSVLCYIGSF